MKKQALIEGVHYYFNNDGYFVFAKQYHLERGYCCGFACKHCPYEYEHVPEPKRTELRNKKNTQENVQ